VLSRKILQRAKIIGDKGEGKDINKKILEYLVPFEKEK
jgi:hypothetical protein